MNWESFLFVLLKKKFNKGRIPYDYFCVPTRVDTQKVKYFSRL